MLLATTTRAAKLLCELQDRETLTLRFNQTSNGFEPITGQPLLRRQRRRNLGMVYELASIPTPSIENDSRLLQQQQQQQLVVVRECFCAPQLDQVGRYCPVEWTACMVYDDGRQECFLNRGGRRFVRGIMPAMLFFYAGLIYLFVVSEQGASARAYCYRKGVLLWFVLVQNKGSSNQQPPQEGNNSNDNSNTIAVVEETATTEQAVALTERREQELLQASADRLHPERAAQLIGLAITRQRGARRAQWIRSQRDRQRQQYLTQRQLQRLGLTEHDLQDNNNDNNNNNNNNNNNEEEQQQQPRPTHLALKTKVYSVNMDNATTTAADADAADAVDEDNSKALHWTDNIRNHFKLTTTTAEEEATTTTRCAICLSNFQNGNRVGDLPCGHLFHKDCLKAWLQRKNQCPLCNNDRVAQPFCKTVPQNDDDNDEEQEQVTPTTTTTNETNAATTTTDNIRQEEEEDDDEEEARNK